MISRRLGFMAVAGSAFAGLAAATKRAVAAEGRLVQGTPIGLDHDPGGNLVAEMKSDGHGVATFDRLIPGKYLLFVPDLSRFQGPMVFSVKVNGGPALVSAPMRPRAGRAYAMDASGRRLVLSIERQNGRIEASIFDRWGNL